MIYNSEGYFFIGNTTCESTISTGGHTAIEVLSGIIVPLFIVINLPLNLFIIVIFLKTKFRSATTVLLANLCVSQTATEISSYLFEPYKYWKKEYTNIPYPFCGAYYHAGSLMAIFFANSVFLTITIGLQRCFVVAFPFKAIKFNTVKTIYLVSSVLLLISISGFLPLLLFTRFFKAGDFDCSKLSSDSCILAYYGWHPRNVILFVYVFQGIFVNIVPSIILIIATAYLIYNFRKNRLSSWNQQLGPQRDKDTTQSRTTFLVILILIIFLIVEIPFAVIAVVTFLSHLNNYNWTYSETYFIVIQVQNAVAVLCAFLNFWVYVTMSKKFRHEIIRILKRNVIGNCIIRNVMRIYKKPELTNTRVTSVPKD